MGIELRSSAESSWVTVRQGPWQWSLRGDVPRSLLDALAVLDEPDFQSTAAATLIKQSTVRRVIRLAETPLGSAVYCKDFRTTGWRAWGRALFRGSPAAWEASRIRLAQARQIPTAELVATGVRCGLWSVTGSRLVTRSLDDVRPLSDWRPPLELPDADDVELPDRDAWRNTIADLIARLHGRGLWHGDLHAGNVLLRHTGSLWQSWLIDLSALRGSRVTPIAHIFENLGRFWMSLGRLCTESELCDFTHRYWETLRLENLRLAEELGATADHAWELLHRKTREALVPVHRTADRAFQRGNRKILLHADGRSLANLGAEWWAELRRTLPKAWAAAAPLFEDQGVICRRLVLSTPVGERTLRIWRWESRQPASMPPARLAWEIGHALLRRGVPLLVPWGIIETPEAHWLVACEPRNLCPPHTGEIATSVGQSLAERSRVLAAQLQAEGFTVQGAPLAACGITADERWCGWCRLDWLRRSSGATWV